MMKYVIGIFLFSIMSTTAIAGDPFTSVYKSSVEAKAKGVTFAPPASDSSNWKFFNFSEEQRIFGGFSVDRVGDAQSVKLNAVNYRLFLGGTHYIPFQVYFSDAVSNSANQAGNHTDSNTAILLDPESGKAFKFPLMFIFQNADENGYCHFPEGNGHCAIGGDVTFHFKNLKTTTGNSETAFGKTVRVGASLLFPVVTAIDTAQKGYLAIGAKLVYAQTDISDSTQLFTPVNDVNGNPVKFQDSIFSSEMEVKFSLDSQFSISAKWLRPLQYSPYLTEQFKLSLESQI